MSRVLVIGAGVIGLSCGVRLAEAGHRVDVVARDLPLETTSAVAAAIWYPYLAEPRERVLAWGAAAYRAFEQVAAEEPDPRVHGVRLLPGTEALASSSPDPWWAAAVPDLRRAAAPEGYADAWSFTTPVIDMAVYLPWLRARLEALGATVTRMSLSGLPVSDDVVVDCAGLGARLLAGDPSVRPVRGQVVLLDGVRLDRWALDGAGPTYVVPRLDHVVVGGTEEPGEWSRTPSPPTADSILRRASRLVPQVAAGRVVRHKVGLRPVRPAIRVEAEGRTVHCYGHGGAGVTLSWGCADEVAQLVSGLG